MSTPVACPTRLSAPTTATIIVKSSQPRLFIIRERTQILKLNVMMLRGKKVKAIPSCSGRICVWRPGVSSAGTVVSTRRSILGLSKGYDIWGQIESRSQPRPNRNVTVQVDIWTPSALRISPLEPVG